MKFTDFFASKLITLCFLTLGLLVLLGWLLLIGVEKDLLLMLLSLLLLVIMAWLVADYLLARRRLARLEAMAAELEEKYVLAELLPKPANAVERCYFQIMKTVSRSAVEVAEEALHAKEDYCAYVESWVHELKTPLTACSLILDNDADAVKLKRELKRADNLTENILYYARLRTVEKDTQISRFTAAEVINEAVQSQMELLIAAHISVETRGDMVLYSDKKLLGFIIRQLLINSAQYCPACHIIIAADDSTLVYEDNGIGIPQHELARICERGFTGTNGRSQGNSTGMGLYIVSELCRQLAIKLTVSSQQGQYTRFTLVFAAGNASEIPVSK